MEFNFEDIDGVTAIECTGVADRNGARQLSSEIETRIRRREKKFIVDLTDVSLAGRDLAMALSSTTSRLRGPETRMVIVTKDAGLREAMEKVGLMRLAYVCRTRQEADVELGLESL